MDPGLPCFGALGDIKKGLLLSLFLCQSFSFHLLTVLGSIRSLSRSLFQRAEKPLINVPTGSGKASSGKLARSPPSCSNWACRKPLG